MFSCLSAGSGSRRRLSVVRVGQRSAEGSHGIEARLALGPTLVRHVENATAKRGNEDIVDLVSDALVGVDEESNCAGDMFLDQACR